MFDGRMIPAPGRIMHVTDADQDTCDDNCRPAICSGVEMAANRIFFTVFDKNKMPEQTVDTYDSRRWHWPVISRT